MGGGVSQSAVQTFYDPNGNTELVVGDSQEMRRFLTNSKGRIVKKRVGQDKEEYYFYTTSDQPLGRFGNIPPDAFRAELTHIDFDLNYHPVSEHFPPPTPSTCLVMTGDTFSSISERMYGDMSFANLIADENGYRQEDIPSVGLMLQIPNIVNTNIHNWEGQYPLYNPTAIIGSLYPNMSTPGRMVVSTGQQSRKHRKFWHILVEAIVGSAIMVFAPEFAGILSGVLGKLLGEAAGFALAGAASNLVQQELAIQLGDQQKLTFGSLGQSALLSMGTAGIAKVVGLNLMKSASYRGLIDDALKNIELTIATQGLSFATGQQRHFDWRVFLASLSNTLANVGTKQMDFGASIFNDAVATASASVASIGIDKMYRRERDVESIVANALGTYIGNQLAAQTKQHYAEYQLKKSFTAQVQESQIPEIRQELAASEQQFLQSIRVHANEVGSADSSTPPSQRTEHHAKAMRERPASQQSPNKHSVHKQPHQPHLLVERAREEELLTRSSHRASKYSRTEVQKPQPSQSQHRFWTMLEKANNSRAVLLINQVGDKVAHTILDMVNPVKIAKTAWADAHESVEAFHSGHVFKGMALMGETALDVSIVLPLGRGLKYGAQGVSAVGSRLGLFGGRAAAVEKSVQFAPTKHPLTGLSQENVIRLANELGLKTPRDQLVLWSGLGRENAGIRISKEYVAKYGGMTLEMTPGGAWLYEMDVFAKNSPFSYKQATQIWDSVSSSLTQQASGQVRSLLGQVRPKSIYSSQEILELQMNSRVMGIDELHLRPKFDTVLR